MPSKEVKLLNFGSLNIDHVYRVDHIARPGETLSSDSYQVFAGGKGANQSVALARAGARVFHAGQVGADGRWLIDRLSRLGVDTTCIQVGQTPTGHAVIQVDAQGQNSIVLFPGANHAITRQAIDETLEKFSEGNILLLQNEINEIPYLLEQGKERRFRICFNPAPFHPELSGYPLDQVDILVLNETEGMGLSGADSPDQLLDRLAARYPRAEIVLTLGARGALYHASGRRLEIPAVPVEPVDTTAAGDTFIGYFLSGRASGIDPEPSLRRAARAAALCVSRPGAQDSIPAAEEVERFS